MASAEFLRVFLGAGGQPQASHRISGFGALVVVSFGSAGAWEGSWQPTGERLRLLKSLGLSTAWDFTTSP